MTEAVSIGRGRPGAEFLGSAAPVTSVATPRGSTISGSAAEAVERRPTAPRAGPSDWERLADVAIMSPCTAARPRPSVRATDSSRRGLPKTDRHPIAAGVDSANVAPGGSERVGPIAYGDCLFVEKV